MTEDTTEQLELEHSKNIAFNDFSDNFKGIPTYTGEDESVRYKDAVSLDSSLLAISNKHGLIFVMDINAALCIYTIKDFLDGNSRTKEPFYKFSLFSQSAQAKILFSLSHDESFLSISYKNILNIYSVVDLLSKIKKPKVSLTKIGFSNVYNVQWSSYRNHLAITNVNKEIFIYRLETNEFINLKGIVKPTLTCCWNDRVEDELLLGLDDGSIELINTQKPEISKKIITKPMVLLEDEEKNFTVYYMNQMAGYLFVAFEVRPAKGSAEDTELSAVFLYRMSEKRNYSQPDQMFYLAGADRQEPTNIHMSQVHDNLLLLTNNSGTGVDVLLLKDQKWVQLSLDDTVRAELPFDTNPMGMSLISQVDKTILVLLDTESNINLFNFIESQPKQQNGNTNGIHHNLPTSATKKPIPILKSSNSSSSILTRSNSGNNNIFQQQMINNNNSNSINNNNSFIKPNNETFFKPVTETQQSTAKKPQNPQLEKLIKKTEEFIKNHDSKDIKHSFQVIQEIYLKINEKLMIMKSISEEFKKTDMLQYQDINKKLSLVENFSKSFTSLKDDNEQILYNNVKILDQVKELEKYKSSQSFKQSQKDNTLYDQSIIDQKMKIDKNYSSIRQQVGKLEDQLKRIYSVPSQQGDLFDLSLESSSSDANVIRDPIELIQKTIRNNAQQQFKHNSLLQTLEAKLQNLTLHQNKISSLKKENIDSIVDQFSNIAIKDQQQNPTSEDTNQELCSSNSYKNFIQSLKKRQVSVIKPKVIDVKKILKPDEMKQLELANVRKDIIENEKPPTTQNWLTTASFVQDLNLGPTSNNNSSASTASVLQGLKASNNNDAFSTSKYIFTAQTTRTPIQFENLDEKEESDQEEEENDYSEEEYDDVEDIEEEEVEKKPPKVIEQPKYTAAKTAVQPPKLPQQQVDSSSSESEEEDSNKRPDKTDIKKKANDREKEGAEIFKNTKMPTSIPDSIRTQGPSPSPLVSGTSLKSTTATSPTNIFGTGSSTSSTLFANTLSAGSTLFNGTSLNLGGGKLTSTTSPSTTSNTLSSTTSPSTATSSLGTLFNSLPSPTSGSGIFSPTTTSATSTTTSNNGSLFNGLTTTASSSSSTTTSTATSTTTSPTPNQTKPSTTDSTLPSTSTTVTSPTTNTAATTTATVPTTPPSNNNNTTSTTSEISFTGFGLGDDNKTPTKPPTTQATTPSSITTPSPFGNNSSQPQTPTSPFTQSTASVFANSNAPSTVTTPSSIFSNTSKPAASVFAPSGNLGTVFGQQQPTSVFGQPVSQTPAFGQSTTPTTNPTSVFGQTTNTTTSTFGQSTTSTTNPTSVFGQSSTAPTTTFGQTSTAPTTFGQTSTAPTATNSVFGQTAFGQSTTPATSTVFGQSTPSTTTTAFGSQSGTTGAFGQSTTPTAFGQSTTPATSAAFGQSTTTPFGQPTAPTTTSFGQSTTPTTFGQQSTTTQPFGQTTQSTTSAFGQPFSSTPIVFGQQPTTTSTFGQPSGTTSAFGQPSGTTSAFGQPSGTTSAFGQPSGTTSAFGQPSGTTSAFGGGFGQTSAPTSAFGQPSNPSTSVFGQTSNTASAFGQTSAPTSAFGQPSNPSTSVFGSAFGQPSNPSGNVFGQSTSNPSGSVFGASKTVFGSSFQNPSGQQSFTFGGQR
ncbi:WD40-like domain-containing protein [Tieghemostelium lacteum]|uniref:WD40-like domain-containing protein n=1 Tax=Tieghemostelium lacteum TaxID=361077 RepID=A0A152A5P0_TIELA|nr:WD40-like domain-containing protein [Tieghemostelium lacteum]|eukprot:KYR01550.1 WD40-like domain-containing protein [Tieghemostelium lacteum]